MTYVTGSLVHISGIVFSGVSSVDSTTMQVMYDALLSGESSSFSVDVIVDEDIVAPFTLTNTAYASWTSQSGTPDEERTGTGGVNDYTTTDTEMTLYTNAISIDKALIATSETHTA